MGCFHAGHRLTGRFWTALSTMTPSSSSLSSSFALQYSCWAISNLVFIQMLVHELLQMLHHRSQIFSQTPTSNFSQISDKPFMNIWFHVRWMESQRIERILKFRLDNQRCTVYHIRCFRFFSYRKLVHFRKQWIKIFVTCYVNERDRTDPNVMISDLCVHVYPRLK